MRMRRVMALSIALVVLLGAAWWGWSAVAWRMPVDSYTLVVQYNSGQTRAITVHDTAKAEAERDVINSVPTSLEWPDCNTALWADPQFGFTLTFFNDGVVIETVIAGTYDCRGTIQVIGAPPVYEVGATYLVPTMLDEP